MQSGLELARLLQSRGRREEAYGVLEECLAQLHEGEDVGTVRQARLMMNELAELSLRMTEIANI